MRATFHRRGASGVTAVSLRTTTKYTRLHRHLLSPLQSMGLSVSRIARLKASRNAANHSNPQDEDTDLFLVVGLGNPGARYAHTRHNIGFMTIDALAERECIDMSRLQDNAAVGRGRMCGHRVLLAKPLTFMNVSGESVGKLSRYYNIPPERIVVIYDDLDLAPGTVRLRAKGGHGGHNGMKSIQAHLQGSKDFPRVRIGIGRPDKDIHNVSIATYVLQNFRKDEGELMEEAIRQAIEAVRAVLALGMEKALSGLRVDVEGRQRPTSKQTG